MIIELSYFACNFTDLPSLKSVLWIEYETMLLLEFPKFCVHIKRATEIRLPLSMSILRQISVKHNNNKTRRKIRMWWRKNEQMEENKKNSDDRVAVVQSSELDTETIKPNEKRKSKIIARNEKKNARKKRMRKSSIHLNPLKSCFDFSNKWQNSKTIFLSWSSLLSMLTIPLVNWAAIDKQIALIDSVQFHQKKIDRKKRRWKKPVTIE